LFFHSHFPAEHIQTNVKMDPSAFAKATPQIIMPEGYEQGRGKFEMALGFIGAGVGAGYATGCSRGFLFELANPETKKLVF
jgi:hypothetical protein